MDHSSLSYIDMAIIWWLHTVINFILIVPWLFTNSVDWFGLIWFYGTSSIVGYLMTNPVFTYIFFFILQGVKAHAIPCPHQLPTRGDNTVSVAQDGTPTPGATKQLLPPDRVLRELYIYMPDQLRAETTLDVHLHFQSAVCDLKKKVFTFGGWCYYAFTVTVSYVITRERWFRVYFLHAENFSLLFHGLKTIWGNFQTAASDSYFWKKRNDWVSYKTKTTNLNKNHMAYPTLFHAVSRNGFSSARVLPPGFLPRWQSIQWGGHTSLNWTMLQCPAAFLFE